ncbi:hypothetical protein D3C87_1223960 [compost metagenome]
MAQQNSPWKGNRTTTSVDRRHTPVGTGLNSLSALRDVVQPERKPQVQPEPLKFEGALNAWYKTVRNGVTSKIFLVEIRKDVALFKDKEEDKHTQSLSLAKFMKFYVAV